MIVIATVTQKADVECERAMTKLLEAQLKFGDFAAPEPTASNEDRF